MGGLPQRYKLIPLCALLLSALFSNSTLAATITITDLEDVDFGDLPPTSQRIAQRIRACVNSTPAGPYRLLAQGFTSDGSFHLLNGANETLEYRVRASNRRNRLGRQLESGVAQGGFFSRRSSPRGRCRPPFLWITVLVRPEVLQQSPGGDYRGTLQITVAPE